MTATWIRSRTFFTRLLPLQVAGHPLAAPLAASLQLAVAWWCVSPDSADASALAKSLVVLAVIPGALVAVLYLANVGLSALFPVRSVRASLVRAELLLIVTTAMAWLAHGAKCSRPHADQARITYFVKDVPTKEAASLAELPDRVVLSPGRPAARYTGQDNHRG